MLRKLYTLVFVRQENQILLGMKKRGFGVNKWNGFGGKVEPNESIIEAAARELKEECSLEVKTSDLKNIGHLEFTFEGQPTLMDVRVYSTDIFTGKPTESEEMRPKWFDVEDIPFDEMWLDDRLWFPYMFQGKTFFGRFHYEGFEKILNYKIEELESMDTFYENRE
ncbi:oxidized purine nucleoside triphosphate hydrolase-like [Amyelois transitella]|uniref:oxidized purine nucleoside triphosphate hydrolase-like n=1 Tax=Amyelois transitella TaxID=680683 RepID=UPI0029905532|nr:oxidized purine nucleoside triphosphate hydrolase-like [Amyelois transitella]